MLSCSSRTRTAEWETGQVERDRPPARHHRGRASSALDDDLRVDSRTPPPTSSSGAPPGRCVGRSAIEAFIDPTIEAVAETARETGAANGELTLRRGRRADARRPRPAVAGRRASGWSCEDVSELRRLQRIRAEFIDNLSHELRTPLTTVSLLAETLVREADAAGEAIPRRMRDRIGKIEVETDHLVQMVKELLDLSRIESGGPIGVLDEVDLRSRSPSPPSSACGCSPSARASTLRDRRPGGVPPVRGAEDRLGQVLVNLLHNAVKFSPDGGEVVVRVAVVGRSDGHVGRGPRDRHPPGRPGADLRALLQGRPGPVRAGRRHGPRAWPSPGTSSSSTAAGSGSSPRRARLDVLVRPRRSCAAGDPA